MSFFGIPSRKNGDHARKAHHHHSDAEQSMPGNGEGRAWSAPGDIRSTMQPGYEDVQRRGQQGYEDAQRRGQARYEDVQRRGQRGYEDEEAQYITQRPYGNVRYTTQLPDEEEEQNNTQLGIRLALVGLAGGLGLLQALLQNRQRRDQTRMWCDGQRQDRGGMRWGRQRQEQRGMRWGRGQARKQSGGLGGILATLGKTQDILLGSVGIAQGILDTTQGVFSSGMGTAQDVFSNGMDTAQDVMARNAKQARKNWKRTQKNLGRNMTRTQYTLGEHSRRVGGHLWNAASTVYGLPGNVGGALGEGSRRAGRHIWNTATNVYSFPGNARERYARQACRQARARRLFDWGLAIGAVVAMLYAPIPGSELRRRLVSQWQQYNTYRAA